MQDKEQIKSPIKQKILLYLETIGTTPYEFYKITGVTRGVLGQNNGISEENLSRFLDYYKDVNPEWLLTGNGSMLRADQSGTVPNIQVIHQSKSIEPRSDQSIPLYNVSAAANLQTLFCSDTQDVLGRISIPDSPRCDGAVYVTGDSMYPLLKSGDIIAYKQLYNPDNMTFGEMYMIQYTIDGDQSLVIKYIQPAGNDNYVRLVSFNEHHAPKDIPRSAIDALAIVKFSIRKNTML